MNAIFNSGEMNSSETGYNLKNENYFMEPEVLVCEQDIINTYSEKEKLSCKKYFEYQKLIQENPLFGYKKCAKLLGIKAGQVRWWHTKGAKRAIPLPLKAVEKLKSAGLIPFTEKHKNAEIIFNILGTLFGDGGIDIRLNTMAFISSDKRDVDFWGQDLLKVFPFAEGKISIIEGGEWGHSFNIRTFDRSIVRFFVALGAPVGSKVATKNNLPKNIFDLPKELRLAFLDGLLASEVSVPQFRDDNRWNCNKRFTNFSLGLSKIDELETEHKTFLEDLKNLCSSVELTCTPNLRKETGKINRRKDGHNSCCYRIFFQTHHEKILKFNEKFSLRYATDKKQRLKAEIEKAFEHKRLKQS